MLIAGGNLPITSYGKKLPDGGIAVLCDETIEFAIAEERLTRIKCDGGFAESLSHYLKHSTRKSTEIDLFVLSSCCDLLSRAPLPDYLSGIECVFCPHHLSHAIGSFVWSPFREAVAIVIDSGGDNCEEVPNKEWWKSAREQHSLFHLTTSHWDLLERHASEPNAAGFGELFRAFTYYLGWSGARYAGNTMALSVLGDPFAFGDLRIFDMMPDGHFNSHIENDPTRPIEMIQSFLEQNGIRNVRPRGKNAPFTKGHFDLAALIQVELERYLEETIERMTGRTGCKNIVLSGGVAYNCVSVGRLREKFKSLNFYVQPASGDVGQGFGNACFGFFTIKKRMPQLTEKVPALGTRYRSEEVGAVEIARSKISAVDDPVLSKFAALISSGQIGAMFQGRSEYGPRALGHRSLVGAATIKISKRRVNRIKKRSYFMPLSPSVLEEAAGRYFNCTDPRPHMTEVVKIRDEWRDILSSVVHADDWCRIQTVSQRDSPQFHRLIEQIGVATGVPVVLNTSLNSPGEPIVERPIEAFEFFVKNDIDCAWIDGRLFSKDSTRMGRYGKDYSMYAESFSTPGQFDALALKRRLQLFFPDLQPYRREYLSLSREYLSWLAENKKQTTIRYKPQGFEYPRENIVPMYATEQYEAVDVGRTPLLGSAEIVQLVYKAFGDLDEVDAKRDGFQSLSELETALSTIYGPIPEDAVLTIYSIVYAPGKA